MTYQPAHLIPATEGRKRAKTRAEYLEAAEARQPREGINSKFCRASHAELAHADMMIGWRLQQARAPKVAEGGFRLTPYGLEKVS